MASGRYTELTGIAPPLPSQDSFCINTESVSGLLQATATVPLQDNGGDGGGVRPNVDYVDLLGGGGGGGAPGQEGVANSGAEEGGLASGLPAGRVGIPYSQPLPVGDILCVGGGCSDYGGLPSAGYVLRGVLPAGLTIINGRVSGTPQVSGNYVFIVCTSAGCSQYALMILPDPSLRFFTFGEVLRVFRMVNSEKLVARRNGWGVAEEQVTFGLE